MSETIFPSEAGRGIGVVDLVIAPRLVSRSDRGGGLIFIDLIGPRSDTAVWAGPDRAASVSRAVDQRVFQQGAEASLPGSQQHGRLHVHVERHHDHGEALTERPALPCGCVTAAALIALLCSSPQFDCCGVSGAEDFEESLFRLLHPSKLVPEACCQTSGYLGDVGVEQCVSGSVAFRHNKVRGTCASCSDRKLSGGGGGGVVMSSDVN